VEDVVTLGQEVEVRVDEIDPQGKVSLSLAGEPAPADGGEAPGEGRPGSGNGGGRRQGGRGGAETASSGDETASPRRRPSFEDAFESQLQSTFGDLGPADLAQGPPAGGARRSSEAGGGGARRGSGGGSGAARRRPRSGGR
jgi:polyribonucleotide nucleotidyltransferase